MIKTGEIQSDIQYVYVLHTYAYQSSVLHSFLVCENDCDSSAQTRKHQKPINHYISACLLGCCRRRLVSSSSLKRAHVVVVAAAGVRDALFSIHLATVADLFSGCVTNTYSCLEEGVSVSKCDSSVST